MASPVFGAIPNPILKPPLAMNSPGRSGCDPKTGARDLARGRTPAQRSMTLASERLGIAFRARVRTSSSCESTEVGLS